MEHKYKGYVLVKNGTSKMPWNVYKLEYNDYLKRDIRVHVLFGETMKECKQTIDSGCIEMCDLMCN